MFIKSRSFVFLVILFSVLAIFAVETAHASGEVQGLEKKIKFSFANKPINEVLAFYAKASGETIIIDPSLKGTVSIIAPGEVTVTEAFDLLSTSMAFLQFAFVRHADHLVIETTRNAMHDELPVVTELPSEKPERYLTFVYTPKHASVDELYKNLRSLVSRDGEMLTYRSGNALLLSDWISNLLKIRKILDALDVPPVAVNPPALNMKE